MDSNVIKSGYLVKLDTVSQRSWKKRFMILTASALTYYEDHQHLQKPKGSILMFSDSSVEQETNSNGTYKNCFVVRTPYTDLHVSSNSEVDRDSWIQSIQEAIRQLKVLPRVYATKKGGLLDGGNKKKFFVMHPESITYHSDPEHIKTVQGSISLKGGKFEFHDDNRLITIQNNRET